MLYFIHNDLSVKFKLYWGIKVRETKYIPTIFISNKLQF